MKTYVNRALQVAGDVVRGASALATGIVLDVWYDGAKGDVLSKKIGDIGHEVGGAISPFLTTYGAGELLNTVKDYSNDSEADRKPTVFDHAKRVMVTAPMATLPLYYATDGDLAKSVFIPALTCVAGHLIGYIGRAVSKKQKAEVEMTSKEYQKLYKK